MVGSGGRSQAPVSTSGLLATPGRPMPAYVAPVAPRSRPRRRALRTRTRRGPATAWPRSGAVSAGDVWAVGAHGDAGAKRRARRPPGPLLHRALRRCCLARDECSRRRPPHRGRDGGRRRSLDARSERRHPAMGRLEVDDRRRRPAAPSCAASWLSPPTTSGQWAVSRARRSCALGRGGLATGRSTGADRGRRSELRSPARRPTCGRWAPRPTAPTS